MDCMLKVLILAILSGNCHGKLLTGSFWHITDLHWDPTYRLVDGNSGSVCNSSGNRPTTHAGTFGDYVCDSPWDLISSSVHAMKNILPEPDFILWTGNKVYSALGNHDYHPKSQLPPTENNMYEQIQKLWEDWLDPASRNTFKKGGYYTEKLLNQTGLRVLVLNTNLYYDQNKITENMKDPADQFKWADQVLSEASKNNEKVYIVGHVPPGFFEKKRHKPWFRSEFNNQYIELIQKHHEIIIGQFFGHHHTDSFRMFYSTSGSPISAMFLTPGVTPWKTTLPGVVDGANNPAIRVFEYNNKTLLVEDIVTYYLNLTYANIAHARWEKEYRLTEAFRVPDASPVSMHRVLDQIAHQNCYLQKYYGFNSVNYDLSECNADCRIDHVCAMREVGFEAYEHCVQKEEASSTVPAILTIVFALSVSLWGS
ncbi:hypothetical protein HF521_017759 [Silurus meridionalis]|uniref:Acid sphingomyelinase-like phosphodiesterase n=1 Tax=Silurus meridionalis TaxID=175797 RepID=A0A8T0BN41_SILME|nr:hypothetical protein HF521_017759 [Silurus meridionalis]